MNNIPAIFMTWQTRNRAVKDDWKTWSYSHTECFSLFCSLGRKNFERILRSPREEEFWMYSFVPSGERILSALYGSLWRKNFERTLWFLREKELWAYSMVPSGERIMSVLYGSLGRKICERTLWFPREKEFWTYLLYRILSTISSVSVGLTM